MKRTIAYAAIIAAVAAVMSGCQAAPTSTAPADTAPAETTPAETVQTTAAETTAQTEQSAETSQAVTEQTEAVSAQDTEKAAVTEPNEFLNNLNEQMDKFNSVSPVVTVSVDFDSIDLTVPDIYEYMYGENADAERAKAAAPSADASRTVTVGSPEYGYLNVPADWDKAEHDPNIESEYLEFDDPTGKHEIVLTNKYNYNPELAADDIYDMFEEDANYTVTYSCRTKVDGYTAYRIDADKAAEGTTIVVWIFQDDDLMTHYLTAESPDIDSILPIAATYRLKN